MKGRSGFAPNHKQGERKRRRRSRTEGVLVSPPAPPSPLSQAPARGRPAPLPPRGLGCPGTPCAAGLSSPEPDLAQREGDLVPRGFGCGSPPRGTGTKRGQRRRPARRSRHRPGHLAVPPRLAGGGRPAQTRRLGSRFWAAARPRPAPGPLGGAGLPRPRPRPRRNFLQSLPGAIRWGSVRSDLSAAATLAYIILKVTP